MTAFASCASTQDRNVESVWSRFTVCRASSVTIAATDIWPVNGTGTPGPVEAASEAVEAVGAVGAVQVASLPSGPAGPYPPALPEPVLAGPLSKAESGLEPRLDSGPEPGPDSRPDSGKNPDSGAEA
ncbi:hypothetical protein GCM10009582_22960 [Arthrobacter flavus]